jgi:hypothetical protein
MAVFLVENTNVNAPPVNNNDEMDSISNILINIFSMTLCYSVNIWSVDVSGISVEIILSISLGCILSKQKKTSKIFSRNNLWDKKMFVGLASNIIVSQAIVYFILI